MAAGPRRVLLFGATGTIGRATADALAARGHRVTAVLRPGAVPGGLPAGVETRAAEVTDTRSILEEGLRGDRFDAILSCLASRTGTPRDAWAIDHGAHLAIIAAARAAGVPQMILLSALCVQRPELAFQHAKLAAERALARSGLTYSIVRPTAFFKSLSGQIGRVRAGKPYLLFGDGRLTACKPISDRDLAAYLAECLDMPERRNRILPIGGPGAAVTPREQGDWLFALTGRAPRFRRVPVGLLDLAVVGLGAAGRLSPRARDAAEFARIGRHYATRSMLVLDPGTGRYDAELTPSTGRDSLRDFYAQILGAGGAVDRGDHAFFS